MTKATISATDAVRGFSELLDGIRSRGARYTIVRGGTPIATIGPVDDVPSVRTLGQLAEVVANFPRLDPDDDDDVSFARDVEAAGRAQPGLPSSAPWE